MKILTIGSLVHSRFLYQSLGWEEASSFDEADFLMFTGGEDVTPKYYNQREHPRTYCNSRRDEFEYRMFNDAISKGKKMLGICRGFQAIHAFQGFPLVQHMVGHNNTSHKIISPNDSFTPFIAPGDHHQNPIAVPAMQLLGVSPPISSIFRDGNDEEIEFLTPYKEVEIGFYPHIQALGFQYHPEWADQNSECVTQTINIIKDVFGL